MNEWNLEFQNISVRYLEHIIQIKTDKALMTYLGKSKKNAVALTRHILESYQEQYGTKLQISEDSMAVEILIHAYLDLFSRGLEQMSKIMPKEAAKSITESCKKVEGHTEIIDSGEKEVDSNRWVFDKLAPYHTFIRLYLDMVV